MTAPLDLIRTAAIIAMGAIGLATFTALAMIAVVLDGRRGAA